MHLTRSAVLYYLVFACLQVLCIAEQIKFCDHVESAMSRLVQSLELTTTSTCSCTPFKLTGDSLLLCATETLHCIW
jgi:hypothetical protein